MSEIISVVFIIFIAVAASRIKKVKSDSRQINKESRQTYRSNDMPQKQMVREPKGKYAVSLMEDRNHDWLAGQLREERRALRRTSEMFDLKVAHASSCDAQMIKDFHSRQCDANGVDTATVN